MRVWEFSPMELHVPGGTTKPVGAIIDLTNGRPGTYTTNLTYTVSADIGPGNLVDLTTITGFYTAQSGDILTGTANKDPHISVAAGATIILWSADITSGSYVINGRELVRSGIMCEGDATIILDGMNKVKSSESSTAGIFIAQNHTLTIKGIGSLEVSGSSYGAGIGGIGSSCGNIVIEGGNITANGGLFAAGIGSGQNGSCGTITITGGNITAKGGWVAAGIGSGQYGSCGTITISGGTIIATKGQDSPNSIGAGQYGSCGTVSIASGANVTQN